MSVNGPFIAIQSEIIHWSTVKGFTMTGLAKASKLGIKKIRGYFGDVRASVQSVDAICAALNVTRREFLGVRARELDGIPVWRQTAKLKKPEGCGIKAVMKIIGPNYFSNENVILLSKPDYSRGRRSGRHDVEPCFGGGRMM